MDYTIEYMTDNDWEMVKAIYLEGIETGLATFESEAPTWEKWNSGHVACCRLVARDTNHCVLGWAALSPVSSRAAYKGVAEVSIYIGKAARGHGLGKILLSRLTAESEKNGFWTLQSGIFAENTASIHLHKKCGFRIVGTRERPAKTRNGIWHDVVFMERRSTAAGID